MLRFFLALCCALAASYAIAASDQLFGSWHVGKNSDSYPYMYTVNDSGNFLGHWCDDEVDKCFWMLGSKTKCDVGIQIPAIANSSTGVRHVTLHCAEPKVIAGQTVWRNIIDGGEGFETVITSGDKISIAIPLEGESFKVIRFSLAGSAAASNRWVSLLKEAVGKKDASTKDAVL